MLAKGRKNKTIVGKISENRMIFIAQPGTHCLKMGIPLTMVLFFGRIHVHIHSYFQYLNFFALTINTDPYRYPLYNFYIVPGGVIGWQQGKAGAGGRR